MFQEGDFLLEYKGDLITKYRVARQVEKDYEEENRGCFMYFFKYNSKSLCIDATQDIFSAGRMVNDAIKGDIRNNAEMKIVLVHGKPHLCLFATKDISVNEELRFDYGVPNLPWRKAGEDLFNHEGNAVTNVKSQKDTTRLSDEDVAHEVRNGVRHFESQAEIFADEDVVYKDGNSLRTVDSQKDTLADQDMIHELENDARLVEQSQAEVELQTVKTQMRT
ncbi:N-lysine methyltransferase KMT5A-like [Dreissena polymorpha]|uniref:SET domain-containing protein n=1 Tax=Dreissena polymorpha TaxID=45954 RepID=A0A9D4FBN2_DREPO|nr:N-lysine methyltransferase KMT5A-like [Dreissena polymorpha]KAH3794789.1 hypothetical protein DPMN_148327 [Dreissena polymorpha]